VPRTKNQERRRTTLRHAAARAIVSRGSSAISLRDVANEAGVSPSSVLYYYPDLDELVSEAIQQAMERFYDRRHAIAEALTDPREQLVTTIKGGFPSGSDDLDVLLLYLGVPVIRRSRPIGALMRSLTGRQVGLYRSILEVGAAQEVFDLADESSTIAANLVALEDAYGLYVMNGNESGLKRYINLTMSYASLATSCRLQYLPSVPTG
jgi:AcrR family transcriptional regulator